MKQYDNLINYNEGKTMGDSTNKGEKLISPREEALAGILENRKNKNDSR